MQTDPQSLTPAKAVPGIAPDLVLLQVKNTAPFLFERNLQQEPTYVRNLKEFDIQVRDGKPLSHTEYFRLCVSAHWATVATFVPTDVDIHIRLKLWNSAPDLKTIEQMIQIVKEARFWDYRLVSTRWVESPVSKERVSGHEGEWFSIAVAAYACALQKLGAEESLKVLEWIGLELERQDQVFRELSKDGIGLLKASYVIAHNLGDLKRVIEHWGLDTGDALFDLVQDFLPKFDRVSELNKNVMAAENHRHLVLRKPRGLRKSVDFLLPMSPFLDDWGAMIAKHPLLTDKDRGEIIEALVDGQEKMENFVGYARALLGIEEALPGGKKRLASMVPARVSRLLQNGEIRKLMSVPKVRFHEQWNAKALRSN